jgi:hypothetical protein
MDDMDGVGLFGSVPSLSMNLITYRSKPLTWGEFDLNYCLATGASGIRAEKYPLNLNQIMLA